MRTEGDPDRTGGDRQAARGAAPMFIGLLERYAIQGTLFTSFDRKGYREQAIRAIAHVLRADAGA
ncbi:hypothetical protein [Actinobaculum massiliense]|nr:hypothetical protein [Actinobaculum massiliense]MDK8318519.1 hypothetical protein [Actinobaculum massiliense]MDK8566982.1 hypothetical protein [Actinobaculum massiliense]